MRYKVIGDYVVYGGPKNYTRDSIYLSDVSLLEALLFVKNKCNEENIELNNIYSEYVDHTHKP